MRLKLGYFGFYFLRLYLVSIILFLGISIAFYLTANQARINTFKAHEIINIEQQEEIIRHDIQAIVSDLTLLAEDYFLQDLFVDSTDLDLYRVEEAFLVFARNKKKYDQLRFIGHNGMEMVRVDWNSGNPVALPRDRLQNKSQRYYFRDTMSLARGELFISPFDLNVEHGKVEEPKKPMIRFAIPVFNKDGGKSGMVIINFLGGHILEDLDKLNKNVTGNVLLLNKDGFYLRSINPAEEFGFMFPEKKNANFAKDYPLAWQKISVQDSGQFATHDGLFSFVSIHPLFEGLRSSTGSPEAFSKSASHLSARGYVWKIVSHVPARALNAHIYPDLRLFITTNFMLLGLIGVGCWLAADAAFKRKQAELELKNLATRDTLTDLPNRKLLYDRLAQLLAQAERSKQKIAVLFIDLDKFKQINDGFGHEAGDIVLKQTALRLTTALRRGDTVARMGGDEFVALLADVKDDETVNAVAQKLIDVIGQTIQIDSQGETTNQSVGASIGISIYPTNGEDIDSLINAADTAMYLAKKAGRNRYARM
ncbi:GGDEF domain-containing protein [Desulfobacter hydrogenophilus]|uniref:GGDEF domain-containing protein n=1 Tax=Desulfobacter hydrogenophilus TaxID=2291 RepID=A0A328FBW3_9BACT|nr:sensor domain-containing diguanylate cyclase [Desulfobacter hydrogenophilus]NDY72165.1 diguanylate cyclase [Desulfobacter hydrogenophilus]QBH15152.1 GGDEF domain-containing protein [Desulfobacter hydrogenophilus]RAM02174.1 GGDEF domain-containing protein [Desulfobacter hydrogenophilus]